MSVGGGLVGLGLWGGGVDDLTEDNLTQGQGIDIRLILKKCENFL